MKICVINLDRCTDRLDAFRRVNGHLPDVARFSAVEGARVSIPSLESAGLLLPGVEYTPGAIGCALSHISLWKHARQAGEAITIFEDDAIVHHDFMSQTEQVMRQIPPQWDVVLWGWNFDAVMIHEVLPGVCLSVSRFDQNALRQHLDRFQTRAVAPTAVRLHRAFGTVAYTVSPAGAGKLLDHCLPIRPLVVDYPGAGFSLSNCGIDVMMNAAYSGLAAFAAYPPLVVTPNLHEQSAVQQRQPQV